MQSDAPTTASFPLYVQIAARHTVMGFWLLLIGLGRQCVTHLRGVCQSGIGSLSIFGGQAAMPIIGSP
jgi:hypothetical protein